jgi:prepilin-type N-terminal cleavage/methylation domain-containing protein
MPTTQAIRAQKGFSLIELLMVAFIFAIGLLGLTALMATGIRASGGGRQRDTAAYLANDVLERLAADGRMSAMRRANGEAIPGTCLLGNAVDNTANTYQILDTNGDPQSTFDMEGRPSSAKPVFSVEWVRRSTKSVASVASVTSVAEVVVNVSWLESGQGTATTQKWLSCSRMICY